MRFIALFTFLLATATAFAQPATKGFNINRMYTGGSLGLGGGTGFFSFGVNPELGYSLNNWIDVGVAGAANYFRFRQDFIGGGGNFSTIQRSTQLGGGVYVRVYPLPQFFIQLQPEWNSVSSRLTASNSPNEQRFTTNSSSLIGAVGYTQRVVGQTAFYFLVGTDLGTDINSPYRNITTNGGNIILRSGFNFYLGRRR
jgi:hypothetical protein